MPNSKKYWNKRPSFNKNSTKPNSCKQIYKIEISPKFGYNGFQLYFTEESSNSEQIVKNTRSFESYVHKNINLFPLTKIKEKAAFTVDFQHLLNDEEFISEWDSFKSDIVNNAEHCLHCMGLAVHQIISDSFEQNTEITDSDSLQIIRARLVNYDPVLQLKNLRVSSYAKLVSIRGTVIKAGVTKLLCQCMEFECSLCTGTQIVKQIDGNFTLPAKCLSKGCRSCSNFVPQLSSPNTRSINCQTIKIQELVGDDQAENGRVPRTIECELTEDLVSCCIPGDDVTITGIVKVRTTNDVKHKKQPSLFLLYIDAVSVVNEKNSTESGTSSASRITFNTIDYYAIQKIHAEPNLFRLLVQSLCPIIYGQEMVKAGLLLALFGGMHTDNGIRQDSHVLIVGDPGLGKSQMLQACTNVAPRGVYVCGNTSTGSGLTVTMTRESGGDFALEAGALILADQGCCCIDEFDKMTTQHACLLEVMEQQSISIAKAGVTCNLPTRASVLAAANPVGGHYNKSRTVAENLKMGSPLLSRFDLIFILLDQPNEKLDMLLSDHVLALHVSRKLKSRSCDVSTQSTQISKSLKDRLKVQPNETIDHLPHSLFRKYIAYAHKYVFPQLNKEAQSILKQFYLELRKRYHVKDCTPVTARQLESLKRLTQARAKLELREEATEDDALDVVEIARHSLVDIFSDEFGALDFTRSLNGSGISSRKQVTNFLRVLQERAQENLKSTFSTKELQLVAQHAGVPKDRFFNTLQSLNVQGLLLMKGRDTYQLVSADF